MKKKDKNESIGYIRPQTCRNCGINGHLYKDCIHPIMSYGIICYKNDNNSIKYLMIQRKDSLSFMEFIRGKYNISNQEYLLELFSYMTNDEKKLLLKCDFDYVWNYAWSQPSNANIKNTCEYLESKRKFNYLSSDKNLEYLIINSCNNLYEQEWGFPKGRRKLKESNKDCAIREFCEETKLTKNDIDLKNNLNNFEEIFYGTNNILYRHVYYIAKINKNVKLELDNSCLEQVREIRALEWFTYDEVLLKIRDKNIERIEIFKLTDKLIKKEENIL
jgi:8-oxo-dGTP pyrophosphatase MutT (NUDIX family)